MPLVSALVAVHDDARYVRTAIASLLRQTVSDLELIVVDDASTDETPAILAGLDDPRLVLLRNEQNLGLAASLNRGLERAQGRYVARLDADDVALPQRLARQLDRIRGETRLAVVGSAALELDAGRRPGRLHRMPRGPVAVRWHALFSAPFLHNTVLVDRDAIDRRGLRYDESFSESEDYDLWARLLVDAEGENLEEPLVLWRMHAGQASRRRRELQQRFQREVALRGIARIAPDWDRAELAWALGSGHGGETSSGAVDAYLELLERFERLHGIHDSVREAAARVVRRAGAPRRALALVPSLALSAPVDRARRRVTERSAGRPAAAWLRSLETEVAPLRVAVVSPEPTPYRAPLLDLIADRPELELTVIYSAHTVAGRTWAVEPRHRAVYLRGVGVPGVRWALHHDYPVTLGIVGALREARPAVVVVSGWSTFASQAAIAWCRARRVPYVLLVESHDAGPRKGWRRAVKGAVVPRLLRGAAGVLVVGSLARDSVVARGAAPERVRVFANTIDVVAWERRADKLAARRSALRASLGAEAEDVVVLSAARLAPEKGLDTLVQAVAEAGDRRLVLVVAGDGPERGRLERLASEHDVRLHLPGDLDTGQLAEAYVAADVFALLSLREPWGVVVNEAAASGLPLVLSDRVGAAHDLLRDGENGALVAAGDSAAAARALQGLLEDPAARRRAGERSRELARSWGYEPSVESFVAAVREAFARLTRKSRVETTQRSR